MLELALHTPTRHVQAVLAPKGILAFRPPGGDWSFKTPPANALQADRIELLGVGEGVRLKSSIKLAGLTAGGKSCDSAQATRLALPLRFVADDTRVEVVDTLEADKHGHALISLASYENETDLTKMSPAPATLTRWFEALSTLNRWPASSHEFYRSAAELVIDPIGLDGAYVLTKGTSAESWDFMAAVLPRFEQGVWFDLKLLGCLQEAGGTHFHPSGIEAIQHSGAAYVISPWTDAAGEVAGAVVGTRSLHEANARVGVRPLEAHLVGLLAKTIGDIEARRLREAESLRRQVLLRHAFTDELAERIEREPEILAGSAREVSLLFVDMREASALFHSMAKPIGNPVSTFQLLSEVLNVLTEQVLSRAGVVIDYYGDGLAAMWNAPVDQPDHADRACAAGLAMIASIAEVSHRWEDFLGQPLEVGIGIHTGSAVVGDIGSQWKIKYGARGAAVNLASRVEHATRTIDVPLLVTEATKQRLGPAYLSRRLCRTRLAGVQDEVQLYAVWEPNTISRIGCDPGSYAEALALFETDRLDPALRKLTLSSDGELKGAAAFLAEKIRDARHERRGRRLGDRAPEKIDSIIDLSHV